MQFLIDRLISGERAYAGYQQHVEAYIEANKKIQQISNPSGNLSFGLTGLGEPKYNINLTALSVLFSSSCHLS